MTGSMSLIEETGGNLREVARRLGVARSTVYYKLGKRRISIDSIRKNRKPLFLSDMTY